MVNSSGYLTGASSQSFFKINALLDFVPRPEIFEKIVGKLLVEETYARMALTTALEGAGGFGKTSLARAVCHDSRVREHYKERIVWVQLRENITEYGLRNIILDLIEILTGERPTIEGIEALASILGYSLGDQRILLVIDDVWKQSHLEPFLYGGNNCTRLITTRIDGTLPNGCFKQVVDAMKPTEAVALLRYDLPSGKDAELELLAKRLGKWPFLLNLANRVLRKLVDNGETLEEALSHVNDDFERQGFDALRNPDAKEERERAASATIELSLKLLDREQRKYYNMLAIFREDTRIPLVTLEKLWKSSATSEGEVRQLVLLWASLSLLETVDLKSKIVVLHDILCMYLQRKHRNDLPEWNRKFLEAYGVVKWDELPGDEIYLWDHLVYHLRETRQSQEMIHLVLDWEYLAKKTLLRGTFAVQEDIDLIAEDIAEGPDYITVKLLGLEFKKLVTILNTADSNEIAHILYIYLKHREELKEIWQSIPCVP